MSGKHGTAAGIFGKVPWKNEYLRLQAQGEPFAAFDAWITSNVEWATARGGQRWMDAYRSGGVQAFVFRPPAGPLLAGALTPSWDGAGRNFPLVVGAPFLDAKSIAGTPEMLPLALEELWQPSYELLLEVKETAADAGTLLAQFSGAPALPGAEEVASYGQWLETLPIVELWALVYRDPAPSRGEATLRFLLEAIRPYRGVERPRTPLTLRLPLGEAGGAAVCFWIHLVRTTARWKSTLPSFFWWHDGERGELLLHLGDPPQTTLAELWLPSSGRDEFCDLTEEVAPGSLRGMPALRPELGRLFARPEATVADLLRVAADG